MPSDYGEKDIQEAASSSPLDAIAFFDNEFSKLYHEIPSDILSMNEAELQVFFKPTEVDFMLRKKLAKLVAEAKDKGHDRILLTSIYKDICSRQNFYRTILKNQYRMVWLLQPIHDFQELIEESFYFGLKRARNEILTMPITDKNINAFIKLLDLFANRALGPMVQRIEQKNLNMSLDGRDVTDPSKLMEKYEELKSKLQPKLISIKDIDEADA